MTSQRRQVVAAVSVTSVNIAVAITVNVLTSSWSWLVFVVLALLSATWMGLEAWRAAPRPRATAQSPGAPAPPRATGAFVPRPELTGPIVRALLGAGSRKVGITTGLAGAGGFGKTTLAAEICARGDVRAAFAWIDWATVGQEVRGAALADAINDISERIDGRRPGLTSPEQAGIRLGELLKEKGRSLLVVDDVWTAEQLRPFLNAARGCTLLVTTRIPDLLPDDAETVKVDQMSRDQARVLVGDGVGGLPEAVTEQLLDITGRWPLALGLANGALRRAIRDGADVTETADRLLRRLEDLGPAALDVTDAVRRDRAVAVTLESSLGLLGSRRDRVVELAIFPEDTEIPVDLVVLLWQKTAGLARNEGERLCQELIELSLVLAGGDRTAVRLHDIIRTYLRHECGEHRLVELHDALLDAAASALPEPAGRPVPWWTLPPSAGYLWRTLTYHLDGAGRDAELDALVTAPRWVIGKLVAFGPVALAEDLAFATTAPAKELRRFLDQQGHLLIPGTPRHAVVNALAVRLPAEPEHDELRRAAEAEVACRPRLVPRRELPDRPDPALDRVLTGHDGWVRGCAFVPDGGRLVTSATDGLRVWNPDSGELVRLIDGAVFGLSDDFAVSPDGALLACEGPDKTVDLWDTRTWQVRTRMKHGGEVRTFSFPDDGATVITSDYEYIRVWEAATGKQVRAIKVGESLDACLALPGGKILTLDSEGLRILDPVSGERTDVPPRDALWTPDDLALDPGGRWVAAAVDDGLRIHDLHDITAPPREFHHGTDLSAVAFSPDGRTVATGSEKGLIILWDTATWRPSGHIRAHSSEINKLAFAPDGAVLASAGDDGTVRLWDPARARAGIADGTAATGTVTGSCAAPDGSWLAIEQDDTITIRDPASGEVRDEIGYVSGVGDLVPAGNTFLAIEGTREIVVCEVGNWRASRTLPNPTGAFLYDVYAGGNLVAATDGDDRVIVWDLGTWRPPAVLTVDKSGVHPGGTRRLTSRLPGRSRRQDRRRRFGGRRIRLRVAPDDAWVAVAVDNTVYVLEPRTWQTVATLAFGDTFTGINVVPDGRWLVIADGDCVQYWSTTTWAKEREFVSPEIVSSDDGDWSPDGTLLATISEDRVLRVHDSADGSCLTELRVDGDVKACRWLSDNQITIVDAHGIFWFSYLPGDLS